MNKQGLELADTVYGRLTPSERETYKSVHDVIRHRKKLRRNGEMYGYPKCCIVSFVNNFFKDNKLSRTQSKVHQNTGFIPCKYCSWKIISGKVKLEELITNRTFPGKFNVRL